MRIITNPPSIFCNTNHIFVVVLNYPHFSQQYMANKDLQKILEQLPDDSGELDVDIQLECQLDCPDQPAERPPEPEKSYVPFARVPNPVISSQPRNPDIPRFSINLFKNRQMVPQPKPSLELSFSSMVKTNQGPKLTQSTLQQYIESHSKQNLGLKSYAPPSYLHKQMDKLKDNRASSIRDLSPQVNPVSSKKREPAQPLSFSQFTRRQKARAEEKQRQYDAKFIKKKQKEKLKNLQRYKQMEAIEPTYQSQKSKQEIEKEIDERIKREHSLLMRRQRTDDNSAKISEEEIKAFYRKNAEKSEKSKQSIVPVFSDLSAMNQHRQSCNRLLFVILSHPYASKLLEPQSKKVPNVFLDREAYEKIFQFLITNEAIASLHTNFNTYTSTEAYQRPTRVKIRPMFDHHAKDEHAGFSMFNIYENLIDKQTNQYNVLKNVALSKYNLVIVSSRSRFEPKRYSRSRFSSDFLFIGCLISPENKQQLQGDLKLQTCVEMSSYMKECGKDWTEAYIFVFQKISTFVREFLAVRNVRFDDLCQYIYNPPLINRGEPTYINNASILEPFFKRIEPLYNSTQLTSIKQLNLRDSGIIMLQGPPGTGKTSTLLGVLAGQYYYLKKKGDLGKTKILVCTPSNTAVDHIVRRIVKEGLVYSSGKDQQNQTDIDDDLRIKPNILRVGLIDTPCQYVRSVYLDDLCDKEVLASQDGDTNRLKWTVTQIKDKIAALLKQIKKLQHHLNVSEDELVKEQIKSKVARKKELEQMAYQLRSKRVDEKSLYNQVQRRLLSEAEIIFTTLSSAGSERLERFRGQFSCLIVDEAGQCTEPNLLIALQLNIRKILLIGDPCQLPATTFSPDSNITLFNRSMFERMLDGGLKPYFLDIQYRMTSQIRSFPSRMFYKNRLKDAPSVLSRQYPLSIQNLNSKNVMFVDVLFGREQMIDKSYGNEGESIVVRILLDRIAENRMESDRHLEVGVITPYKQQVRKLQAALKNHENVFVNTIDSFQGQEKDVIIISCVRANSSTSSSGRNNMGFLIDERRINVALTRAKYLLVVVGNADTLGSNIIWDSFLRQAVNSGCYVKIPNRQSSGDIVKRMLSCSNTPQQTKCDRKIYETLTRDTRKDYREQIELRDFQVQEEGQLKSDNQEKGQKGEDSPPDQKQTEGAAANEQQSKSPKREKVRSDFAVSEEQRKKWTVEAAKSTENILKLLSNSETNDLIW